MDEIRRCVSSDFNQYFRLKKEFCKFHLDYSGRNPGVLIDIVLPDRRRERDFFEKTIRKVNARILVALIDGKIVGYLYGTIKRCKATGTRYGYIREAYVMKGYRRSGVFNRLEGEFIRCLDRREIEWVSLDALVQNTNAIRAFERTGYSKSCFYMVRRLKDAL